jgi:hypothetical protein
MKSIGGDLLNKVKEGITKGIRMLDVGKNLVRDYGMV